MISEIHHEKTPDDLALWAHRRFAAKNTLMTEDASAVEVAYVNALKAIEEPDRGTAEAGWAPPSTPPDESASPASQKVFIESTPEPPGRQKMVTPLPKSPRARNKAHLRYVATQPCLVCQRSPCDAHHIKFAEPRALGAKVSDEYTVPLCREHHQQLHRHGNERAWWANVNVAPLEEAKTLWSETLSGPKNAAKIREKNVFL